MVNKYTDISEPECQSIINSARWAAYGDVVGFISELADASMLKKRSGLSHVEGPAEWKRLIGGKFGSNIRLPKGCYSDDTQLRLSTSRSIRGDGVFDVEAFAKIELPVWVTYALGAGRGSKTAANSLSKQSINWFSNFFEQKNSNYIFSGGNGAAMRVQPHVWSSSERGNRESYLQDVVRNAICTHGHLRGVLGAVFHAYCLAYAIDKKRVPDESVWEQAIDCFIDIIPIIEGDPELSTFWLPVWEEKSKGTLKEFVLDIREECISDVELISKIVKNKVQTPYRHMVNELGAMDASNRGSGTKTAILASALAWLYKDEQPEVPLLEAANLLHSDTDTIATMAGAIIGANTDKEFEAEIKDIEYIESEAIRMFEISRGVAATSFNYPNLHTWSPPKNQLDAVGLVDGDLYISGLGRCEIEGELVYGRGSSDFGWQWLNLSYGQTVLVKRRKTLKELPKNNVIIIGATNDMDVSPVGTSKSTSRPTYDSKKNSIQQQSIWSSSKPEESKVENVMSLSVDELTNEAIKSGFDASIIGEHILLLSTQHSGIEKVIAYSSIIAKAKISRERHPEKIKR